MSRIISWIHFGDLHISGAQDRNYRDFLQLIEEANHCVDGGIAFALLPGDNADDGEEEQYALAHNALASCRIPIHAITGDHDIAGGNLDLFRGYLSDSTYKSFTLDEYRFVLLNSVANWRPPDFGLGAAQMSWLRSELCAAMTARQRVIVIMHAYPSEHGEDAGELRSLFRNNGVALVEMGHTHYNDLANDGRIIYVTTRSTGQVEEGKPGFSATTLDHGVVSWKFKPIREWPLVTITSPSDERLIVDPSNPAQVVRGTAQVRVRAWGGAIEMVTMAIDGGETRALEQLNDRTWQGAWDSAQCADGAHVLTATARAADGPIESDRITMNVNQRGSYHAPLRRPVDYDNVVGEWREKHILGTQLGPNENGRKWPSRHDREEPVR